MASSQMILHNSSTRPVYLQWEPECIQIVLNQGESLTIENPQGGNVCELSFFDDEELTSILAIYPNNANVIFRREEAKGVSDGLERGQ